MRDHGSFSPVPALVIPFGIEKYGAGRKLKSPSRQESPATCSVNPPASAL